MEGAELGLMGSLGELHKLLDSDTYWCQIYASLSTPFWM